MSIDEQETTVCHGRGDDMVQIYTTNTVHLKKLRARNDIVETGGDDEWGTFEAPSKIFDPLSGFRRVPAPRSPEDEAKVKERMRKAREAKNHGK